MPLLPRLLSLGVAVPLLMVHVPTAHAVGVPAPMRVSVRSIPDGFRVCGVGESDSASHSWRLSVEGIRSTRVRISETVTGTAAIFDECVDILKGWSPGGSFVAVFDYVGTGPDLTGHFFGGAEWMSGPEDQAFGSGVD